MPRPFEVVVDSWENQRYKPLRRGWQAPDSIPAFSDITGELPVPFNDTDDHKPLSLLPQGWGWHDDWTIDCAGTFGTCDSDGWSYATTFDTLLEASCKRTLDKEVQRLSMVRRRRWIRTRVCVSVEAKQIQQAKMDWVQSLRERMATVIIEKDKDFDRLVNYESKRNVILGNIFKSAERTLIETIEMLEGVSGKLQLMKAFLIERGMIEKVYSQKLKQLSMTWINAGTTDSQGRPLQQGSLATLSTASQQQQQQQQHQHQQQHQQQSDAVSDISSSLSSQSPAPAPGFFYIVSATNNSVSQRLNDFSNMLCSSLPQDVECVIREVQTVCQDCLKEGPRLRAVLEQQEQVLALSLSTYKSVVCSSKAAAIAESEHLLSTIYTVSAADEFLNGEGAEGGVGIKTAGQDAKYNAAFAASTEDTAGDNLMSSAGHSHREVLSEAKLVLNDVWLALQNHHRAVVNADGALLVYNAFAAQQKKEADLTSSRVSALLQAIIKVFVYEQSRVWEDAMTVLKQVSSGSDSSGVTADSETQQHSEEQDDATESSQSLEQSSDSNKINSHSANSDTMLLMDSTNIDQFDSIWAAAQLPSLTLSSCIAVIDKIQYAWPEKVVGKGLLNRSSNGSNSNLAGMSGDTFGPSSVSDPRIVTGKGNSFSGPSGGGGSFKVAAKKGGPNYTWKHGLVLVTFDGILHIFSEDSEFDDQQKWINNEPLYSVDITGAILEPVLVPLQGTTGTPDGDAFRVYPHQSLSSAVTGRGSSSSSSRRSSAVSPFALLLADCAEAKKWMRVISSPLADPCKDPPEERQGGDWDEYVWSRHSLSDASGNPSAVAITATAALTSSSPSSPLSEVSSSQASSVIATSTASSTESQRQQCLSTSISSSTHNNDNSDKTDNQAVDSANDGLLTVHSKTAMLNLDCDDEEQDEATL